MHHLKLSKSFNFAHVSPKIVKKFQFWAQWDKINSPKSIFAPLCPLILSKSFNFVHSGTEKQSKIYFCPTVSAKIVKKSRFCAQWDKINSPKSIFVPLCPLILSKSFDFSAQWDKKSVQNRQKNDFGPTVD